MATQMKLKTFRYRHVLIVAMSICLSNCSNNETTKSRVSVRSDVKSENVRNQSKADKTFNRGDNSGECSDEIRNVQKKYIIGWRWIMPEDAVEKKDETYCIDGKEYGKGEEGFANVVEFIGTVPDESICIIQKKFKYSFGPGESSQNYHNEKRPYEKYGALKANFDMIIEKKRIVLAEENPMRITACPNPKP